MLDDDDVLFADDDGAPAEVLEPRTWRKPPDPREQAIVRKAFAEAERRAPEAREEAPHLRATRLALERFEHLDKGLHSSDACPNGLAKRFHVPDRIDGKAATGWECPCPGGSAVVVLGSDTAGSPEGFVITAKAAGIPERFLYLASNPPAHAHHQRLAHPRDVVLIHGGSSNARSEAACLAAALALRANRSVKVIRGADAAPWYAHKGGIPEAVLRSQLLVVLDFDKTACDSQGDVRPPLLDAVQRRLLGMRATVIATNWSAAELGIATGGSNGPSPEWVAKGIDLGRTQ